MNYFLAKFSDSSKAYFYSESVQVVYNHVKKTIGRPIAVNNCGKKEAEANGFTELTK